MESADLQKYLDARGYAVLLYEDQLRRLGLSVKKSAVGTLMPVGSAGVFTMYDLAFERHDEKFTTELVDFLKNEVKFSGNDVETIEKQSVYVPMNQGAVLGFD